MPSFSFTRLFTSCFFTSNLYFPPQTSVSEMENQESKVLDAIEAGKKVMDEQSGELASVKKKVGDASNRWRDLKFKVMEKRSNAENNFRQLVKYTSAVDELERWVNVTSASVVVTESKDGKEPDDVNAINKRLDRLKVPFRDYVKCSSIRYNP